MVKKRKKKKREFVSFICIGYLLAFGCNRVGKVLGILFVRSNVSRPNNYYIYILIFKYPILLLFIIAMLQLFIKIIKTF